MKMIHRLGLVFGVIILLFGGTSLLAIRSMNRLAGLTDNLYRHPFVVSTSVLRANSNMMAMHRSMKDVALASNEHQIQIAVNAVNQAEKKVVDDFKRINERFLGNKMLVREALQAFKDWKPIRDEVIALMRSGEKNKAAAITREKGATQVELLNGRMTQLMDFAENKAGEFHENSITISYNVQRMVMVMLVFSLLTGILLAILMTRVIRKQVGGDPSDIEILANKVAGGDFDIEASAEASTGILRALVLMAQSLKRNAERNAENDWLKESSVELNICMRGEQTLNELGRNICRFLVKKMDAAVGGLYVPDDDNQVVMIASYGLGKETDSSKNIGPGEGIIGQAMLDKKSRIINKLPTNYMQITSGTLEIEPDRLLVFPFTWNDRVEAIVELGTVHPFTKLQLTFLEREAMGVAINIASKKSRKP